MRHNQDPDRAGGQEGERGMGPSSFYQGSPQRGWGNQPHTLGVNYGEGQGGMGPSSLHQGISAWGSQGSFNAPISGGWYQGMAQEGQRGMGPSSFYQGPQQRGWGNQPHTLGVNYGEGQGGMGPSSLHQNLPQTGWGTGTHSVGVNYGEGQGGMGPSSLHQGFSWGSQGNFNTPSFTGWSQGGMPQEGQRGMGPSSFYQSGFARGNEGIGQGSFGSQTWGQEGQRGMGPSSLYQGSPQTGWGNQGHSIGVNYGEGQGGMGPSSLLRKDNR